MLNLNLRVLFKSKGIDKPVGWMMKHRMTNHIAHQLLNDKFKRGTPVHHLATICEQLWCTPNDLFVWTPSSPAADQPGHPLQALKQRETVATVSDLLKVLPYEKVEEVRKILLKMKQEETGGKPAPEGSQQ